MSQNHFAPHKHNENAEIAIKISDSFSVTRILKVKLRKVIFFLGIVHTCFLFWGGSKRFDFLKTLFDFLNFASNVKRNAMLLTTSSMSKEPRDLNVGVGIKGSH